MPSIPAQELLDTISNNDPSESQFSGSGEIAGDNITFTLVYRGTNAGYTLNGEGIINSNGSVNGTTEGNRQAFNMGPGSAVRFEGNHGQWVKMSGNKQEAAHSKFGMPVQSKGHIK